MYSSVYSWAKHVFWSYYDRQPNIPRLQRAEQHLRIQLDWTDANTALNDLLGRLQPGGAGLDLLDHSLGVLPADRQGQPRDSNVSALQEILDISGSAWTVGLDPDGSFCLQRRVNDTAEKAAREEMAYPGRAASYLRRAWNGAYGRTPNPSAAYRESVRAVEAAAHLLVTPDDPLPTLGKMISALGDKPEKWTTVIGDVETVLKMMRAIWQAQNDRHGSADETKPLSVSQPEAEAAVQFAVTLVQIFRTAAIRRSDV